MGFAEQHQVHYLSCHAITAHVLHLLMGRNQFLPSFCIHCKMPFTVELYNLESVTSNLLQWPYHSNYKIRIQNIYQHIPHV